MEWLLLKCCQETKKKSTEINNLEGQKRKFQRHGAGKNLMEISRELGGKKLGKFGQLFPSNFAIKLGRETG